MQMLLSSSPSSSSPQDEAVNAIFIAHTLRKILQLSFQKWFIRNTMSLLNISVWRNVGVKLSANCSPLKPVLSLRNGLDVEVKWANKYILKYPIPFNLQ